MFVMIGHMQNVCSQYKYNDDVFKFVDSWECVWVVFFMPAFFVVTGLCSNFNKSLGAFLVSNLKTIIIPSFTLSMLCVWISYYPKSVHGMETHLGVSLKHFVMYGGYWFLSALFVSKLLCFFLFKLERKWKVFVICVVLHILGLHLYVDSVCENYWYFQHALMLTIYLFVGKMFKRYLDYNISLFVLIANWLLYVSIILLMLYLHFDVPRISAKIVIDKFLIFPHLVLSVWGSVLLIYTVKYIKPYRWLLYVGKNTLVYYCLHIAFLGLFLTLFRNMLNICTLSSVMCWLCVLISTVIAVSVMCYLLNLKYIRILLGKF